VTTLVSKRGRDLERKFKEKAYLEDKYMIAELPLSDEEKNQIHRVFERIRRELEEIVRI